MANAEASNARPRAILPNLLYATTYALNKSNTKRAIVGFDYVDGKYKPVVKLCSSGSPSKYVTLDHPRWELVTDHLIVMTAFFQNSYAFYGVHGNPSRVYLPGLDLIYKSSFGAKSVCFEERATGSMVNLPSQHQQRGEMFSSSCDPLIGGNEAPHSSPSSSYNDDLASNSQGGGGSGSAGGAGALMQPPAKKKRFETPPSVTIQEPTFLGLKDMHDCIGTKMNDLNAISAQLNRVIELIVQHLHKRLMNSEEADNAKGILKDVGVFTQYFKANYIGLHNTARRAFDTERPLKDYSISMLLKELIAFGIPWIIKDVNELVHNSFD